MELAVIVQTLSEVGILILCAAVVIWQVVNDKVRQQKREDKYEATTNEFIEALKEQNEQMLEKIINKVDMGHMISSEEDKNTSRVEKELETCLDDVLKETGANRVSLFRYHNGGKDYNGRSFLRMSMTNEVVSGGTAPIQQSSQNLFRSMFFSLIGSLEETGVSYIKDVETVKDIDNGFYGYLKYFDIRAKYSTAVYNEKHSIVGFLTVDFHNLEGINDDNVIRVLSEIKLKVEALLNL